MTGASIWKRTSVHFLRQKWRRERLAAWLFGLGICASLNAGDFVNLGFNDPDLSHAYYESWRRCTVAPVTEALRGWSISTPEPLPYEGFISVSGGAPPLGLDLAGERYGAYMLGMSRFADVGLERPRDWVRIYQTGTIPMGSTLLRFHQFCAGTPSDAPIVVFISGVEQPTIEPWWYSDKSVDVSAFAGQEVTLGFLIPGGMGCNFDIFGFYPVPEPATWALVVLGGAALWRFCRRRRGN